jgi:hypothetical protein
MPALIRGHFKSMLVQAAPVACALVILGGMSMPATANTALYRLTDLGSLGCCNWSIWESSALGLNNAGDVVGTTTSTTDASVTVPFIDRGGKMTAITDWSGEANGINDAGQATGGATLPGEVMPHMSVYRMAYSPTSARCPATRINRSGRLCDQQQRDDRWRFENGRA